MVVVRVPAQPRVLVPQPAAVEAHDALARDRRLTQYCGGEALRARPGYEHRPWAFVEHPAVVQHVEHRHARIVKESQRRLDDAAQMPDKGRVDAAGELAADDRGVPPSGEPRAPNSAPGTQDAVELAPHGDPANLID